MIKKCLCKVYSYDILIVERENQQRGQDMNLKRIAQKLLKMDYKKMCIELEKLHSVLTINQWQIVHNYIMYK